MGSNLTNRAEGDQSDSDSGCVTKDGRPGTCTVRAGCSRGGKGDDLIVCYKVPGFFMEVEFVCCPDTDKPGVVPPTLKGKSNTSKVRQLLTSTQTQDVVSDQTLSQSLVE